VIIDFKKLKSKLSVQLHHLAVLRSDGEVILLLLY
jgi:hypothetical protein